MNRILLATSIAPFETENQKKAVASWLEAGFDVVSLNAPEEISVLEARFPEVRFVPLSRDGRREHGKPFPYVFDIMQWLMKSDYEVIGIINADIHLINFPPELYDAIYESASQGNMLHAHRMETASLSPEDMANAYYFHGIDIFFFHRSILSIFDDDGFCIGNSMWDYWAPMTAAHYGVQQLEIKNLCFWHISHPIRWDENKMKPYLKRLSKKFFQSDDYNAAHSFFLRHMALYNNGLMASSGAASQQKLLCIVPDDAAEPTIRSLQNQTRKAILVKAGEADSIDRSDYAYAFYAQSGHIYEDCALELAIHEMENRSCDKAVLGASYVEEEEGKPYWWKGSFYINRKIALERIPHKYNGKSCKLGFPFSIVPSRHLDIRRIANMGRIVLYPAGGETNYLLENAETSGIPLSIISLCDGDRQKWGKELHGYPIASPERLPDIDCDYVLINSYRYANEIYDKLAMVISPDKLVRIDEITDYSSPKWFDEYQGGME